MKGYKNKTCMYVCTHTHTQTHIQTESKIMEKDIPCEWKPKESLCGNPYLRQNRH